MKETVLTVPPENLLRGCGNFEKIGQEFFGYFKNLAQLQPDENFLDIGCGAGRMAVPLTRYLNPQARYEGFDVRKEEVGWCRENITPKFPNFRFQWADLYNLHYASKGRQAASTYVFPYENHCFDVAVLISVFTHMLPGDMENYISQTARVLKKGGRCLATFFFLNPESRRALEQKISDFKFYSPVGEKALAVESGNPERVLAYDEDFVGELFTKYGFEVRETRYGSWCKRKPFLSYQDILLAVKK